MKTINKLALVAGSALLISAAPVSAQDEGYMLNITKIKVKMGHQAKFREGVKSYMKCYQDNDGKSGWTTWSAIDGEPGTYHVVSRFDSWAEFGMDDAAGDACQSVVGDDIAPHMASVSRTFARHMPDWSADGPDSTVVRLHQFRVSDGMEFREAVGSIVSNLKAADYAYVGNWYQLINTDGDQPDYFVVEGFVDFAAMDVDRGGVRATVAKQIGEDETEELWDDFGDSLYDDNEYFADLLRKESDLSLVMDD